MYAVDTTGMEKPIAPPTVSMRKHWMRGYGSSLIRYNKLRTEKLRAQYAAELKKVTQLQKQWALRKPVLDAHCLTLQKEILRLEQEVDALVMEKLNGDGGSSAHEIGT